MKSFKYFLALSIIFLISSSIFAQTTIKIGPRVTGNFNMYNEKSLTGTWNGIGVGIGGTVDVTFGKTIGILINLSAFDMKNFSNSLTGTIQVGGVPTKGTLESAASIAYITIDALFKAEFSGFYMVAGPSIGIKENSSGELTFTATPQGNNQQQAPITEAFNQPTKTFKFDIAVGTGYNFKLSSDMTLGSDFMAYIPLTDTYDKPGISNNIFSLKLGASLKFTL